MACILNLFCCSSHADNVDSSCYILIFHIDDCETNDRMGLVKYTIFLYPVVLKAKCPATLAIKWQIAILDI